jgi:branched-chain amino acid transport system permease protein
MAHVVQVIVDGLVTGSNYAIVALGFTLVFGVLGVLNVAHADFYTLGAYVSLWVGTDLLGGHPLLGVAAAVVAGAGAGAVLYVLVIHPLRQREVYALFIATIGVSYFIENFIASFVSIDVIPAPPLFSTQFWSIAGVQVSNAQVLLFVALMVIGVGLLQWIKRSQFGRDIRAVAENKELALTVGIRVPLILMVTISLASAIAALGGVLVTNETQSVSPFLATEVSLQMFAIVMVAGAGSVGGALVAGLSFGVVESFVTAYIGAGWSDTAAFVILVIFLIFRPQGIFAPAVRTG